MLVRLTPDQIGTFWEAVERPIESALPPVAGKQVDRMKNILISLLAGAMEMWVSATRADDETTINGVLLTSITVDQFSRTRDLLIYAIYGISSIPKSEWEEGYIALLKWAKVNNCERVVGYTSVPSIINKVKSLGGDADQVYFSLPVE